MRKEYDFSKARRAKDVQHLARLQAEAKGKTRITIMLDNFVIEAFRELAESEVSGLPDFAALFYPLALRGMRKRLVK